MYKHRKYSRGAEYDSADGRDSDELIPDSVLEDDDTHREDESTDKEE